MEPFITTADLGGYLRQDLTGDLMAELAVGSACETLRDLLEQKMEGVVDDVVVIDGPGTDVLLLPELPAHDVVSVELLTLPVGTSSTVPEDAYHFDAYTGELKMRHGLRWMRGRALYRVTYSHGWNTMNASGSGGGSGTDISDLPPLPRSLWILALTMAARIYDQGLVSQESVGGYQVIYSAESSLSLTRGEKNIVAKYRAGRRSG